MYIHMYIYAYCVYIPTCATICLHMCICVVDRYVCVTLEGSGVVHVEIWVSKELSVAWSPTWQQERDVSICFADFEVIRVQTHELGKQVPNCGGWKVLGVWERQSTMAGGSGGTGGWSNPA